MRGFAPLAYDREPRPTTDIDPYAQPCGHGADTGGLSDAVASHLDLVEANA